MASLHSYLHFNGNCETAFNHYKAVFGGDFSTVSRYKDVPPGSPVPEGEEANWIMHVSLPVGGNSVLMGSDRPSHLGPGLRGNLGYIYITAGSREEATRIFNGLSAGGQVQMPLEDTFWGSYFGMCEDKFGVLWMIGYERPQQH